MGKNIMAPMMPAIPCFVWTSWFPDAHIASTGRPGKYRHSAYIEARQLTLLLILSSRMLHGRSLWRVSCARWCSSIVELLLRLSVAGPRYGRWAISLLRVRERPRLRRIRLWATHGRRAVSLRGSITRTCLWGRSIALRRCARGSIVCGRRCLDLGLSRCRLTGFLVDHGRCCSGPDIPSAFENPKV